MPAGDCPTTPIATTTAASPQSKRRPVAFCEVVARANVGRRGARPQAPVIVQIVIASWFGFFRGLAATA